MYIVIIAWMYVAVLMAVAEAVAPSGSVFAALMTFALYGLLPAGLLAYILGTPARKAKLKAQEQAQQRDAAPASPPNSTEDASSASDPDSESHSTR